MTARLGTGALAAGVLLTACASPPRPAGVGAPGEPIAGLDSVSTAAFYLGKTAFNRVYLAEEGLGPAFTENQCSACHTSPASGGFGGEFVIKASRYDPATGCDVLASLGGENVRKKLTPAALAAGIPLETPPEGATVGRFTAPGLYGLGFLEAIPDSVLLSRQDPEDADGDGISGRIGRSADGRYSRFGRKADTPTIPDFVAGAIRLEMGITTPSHPQDAIQGAPPPPGIDPAADPEVDSATLDLLAQYVRLLAPPGRGSPDRGWSLEAVGRGEATFGSIGCTKCHVPVLTTGRHELDVLDRREIALYSDLLLHDMGPPAAGVCGPGATPTEVRTEPLMGVRFRDLLMHHGRVTDLREAILLHRGEAEASRNLFEGLTLREQEELLAFLRTL